MRPRLLALLLVPTVTMAGLGWIVVGRSTSSLNEASVGLEVVELVEAVSDLDRALADEALLVAKVSGDPRLQSQASRREFVTTDQRLEALGGLSESMEVASLRGALLDVESVQGARYDAGLGYVTPLQVVDLYRQARRSALDSVVQVVSERSTNESELMAVMALAESRSAHLDERIAIELALSYGQWAPGQHAAAIEAIATQDTNLRFAETFQSDRPTLRANGSLLQIRNDVELSLDVPAISPERWVEQSDLWLGELEERIELSMQDEQKKLTAAVGEARTGRALTLLVVVAAVTAGSLLLVSSSVRLATRVGLISRRAAELTGGDYGVAIAEQVGGQDEIFRLASSFDEMADRIRRREVEQKLHVAGLEAIAAGSDIDSTLAQISLLLGADEYGRSNYLISLEQDAEATGEPSLVVIPSGASGLESVPWTDETRGALALASMAVRRWQDASQIEAQATYDPLTGVFNRRKSLEMLTDLLNEHSDERSESQPAAAYVDLTEFRSSNETLGKALSDQALHDVASALQRYANSLGGFTGRMDGDQFLIVFGSSDQGYCNEDLQQHLLNLAEVVAAVDVHEFDGPEAAGEINVSCGAAVARPGTTAEQLLFEAHVALSEAKTSGSPVISDEDLRLVVQERLTLRNEVTQALDNGEFVAWYQPIWDRHGRRVVALEALVRWQRADGKVESPFRFLPVLEQQGLLPALDSLMLASVCNQIASWRHRGLPVVPVHVNVSSSRLEEATFVSDTLANLAECGLDSDSLVIEITESGKISDIETGGRRLQALRDEGLLVATDDFGQGYASLAYLQKLPVDILKVDREFVTDIDESTTNQSIVAAVLQLAESLDLEVVVEGVERPEEADWLSHHDCRLQGFLFGRPAPAKETAALLARMRPSSSEADEWLTPAISEQVREAIAGETMVPAGQSDDSL